MESEVFALLSIPVNKDKIDRDCPYCYKDRCVHADAIVRTPPACYDEEDCPLMMNKEV
jgi:hypothetical protein